MQIIDASDRPNDAHGYSVYGLVLMAPGAIDSRVQHVRDLLRLERVMIPAHLTVLGTFCDVESLDRSYEQVAEASARTGMLSLAPTGDIFESPNGLTAGARIEVSPELRSLHDRLVQAILPTATNAYDDPDDFVAHVTYFQEIQESEREHGARLAREFELGGVHRGRRHSGGTGWHGFGRGVARDTRVSLCRLTWWGPTGEIQVGACRATNHP